MGWKLKTREHKELTSIQKAVIYIWAASIALPLFVFVIALIWFTIFS